MQSILGAGAGCHCLRAKHILKNCRDAVRPDILIADPLDTWRKAGEPDLYPRAVEKYRESRGSLAQLELPDDVRRHSEAIVRRADEAPAQ